MIIYHRSQSLLTLLTKNNSISCHPWSTQYSYVSIIRPGLIFLLRDLLYFNGYVIKEVTQQKYKTRSYNRDLRVGGFGPWHLKATLFYIINWQKGGLDCYPLNVYVEQVISIRSFMLSIRSGKVSMCVSCVE